MCMIGAGREPAAIPVVTAAMRDFSQLLDALVYTRSRNAKLKLIGDYLRRTPDPDRGYALAALTGQLDLATVKPAQIRAITESGLIPCCST
jgi:DNA ligase-1